MSLFRLPDELLLFHVLVLLPLSSLQACKLVCHKLDILIKSSSLLAYLEGLERACLFDNPTVSWSEVPPKARLELLTRHNNGWSRLESQWETQTPLALSPPPNDIAVQSGRIIAIRDTENGESFEAAALGYLPTGPDVPPKLSYHNLPAQTISYIYEPDLDLCVFFSATPVIQGSRRCLPQIHLLSDSKFTSHPLASKPILDAGPIKDNELVMGADLMLHGDTLAVTIAYAVEGEAGSKTVLMVWNWITGTKRAERVTEPQEGYSETSVCIEGDLLLRPAAFGRRLELFRISDQALDLICSFELCIPREPDRWHVVDPTFICNGVFTGNLGHHITRLDASAPFLPDSLHNLVVFDMGIEDADYHLFQNVKFIVAVHLRTFVELSASLPISGSDEPAVIPWEVWGLRTFARQIHDNDIFDVYGQRLGILCPCEDTLTIYDLNVPQRQSPLDPLYIPHKKHHSFYEFPFHWRPSEPTLQPKTENVLHNVGFKNFRLDHRYIVGILKHKEAEALKIIYYG